MTLTERLARIDVSIRPLITSLPSGFVTKLYSHGRKTFVTQLNNDIPSPQEVPQHLFRTLWGIGFRSPLFNAAGMFKNGEAYHTMAAQGAGAYLAGTTTALPRMGNTKRGITHPFAPYPHSRSASNWMGLPNRGHAAVALILSRIDKVQGCPIGASVSSDPTQHGEEALASLIEGMEQYAQAGVDFLELNESCPNVADGDHAPTKDELDAGLIQRLETVSKRFIRNNATHHIPVIVKFSNDTATALIPAIVELLCSLGFGGVNFGNTSTRYSEFRTIIDKRDTRLYDYFTSTYGGGVSGAILKNDSLVRSRIAVESIPQTIANPFGEFHVIRTGGIESADDVTASLQHGVSLCQWYSGYFEQFSHCGHSLYTTLYPQIKQ